MDQREIRLEQARRYARFKARRLKAQGFSSKSAWAIAIAKAARTLCGPYTLVEFRKDLANLFRAAYWKKVNEAKKQLALKV